MITIVVFYSTGVTQSFDVDPKIKLIDLAKVVACRPGETVKKISF